jgi:hypothetical protein
MCRVLRTLPAWSWLLAQPKILGLAAKNDTGGDCQERQAAVACPPCVILARQRENLCDGRLRPAHPRAKSARSARHTTGCGRPVPLGALYSSIAGRLFGCCPAACYHVYFAVVCYKKERHVEFYAQGSLCHADRL